MAGFDLVWAGLEAADRVGLDPIKINSVVVKDQNEDEVGDLAALTLDRPWQVRFLEIMPMEGVGEVYDEGLVTSARNPGAARRHSVRSIRSTSSPATRPGSGAFPAPPARSASSPRSRTRSAPPATAFALDRGRQAAALPAAQRRDRPSRRDARSAPSDEELERQIRAGIWRKPWGHGLAEGDRNIGRGMSQIGG